MHETRDEGLGLALREQPVVAFNSRAGGQGSQENSVRQSAEGGHEYLSRAEPNHEVSDERVLGLPGAVAHHHPPAVRLSQFAARWRGHSIRSGGTSSVGKPGARWGFSLLFWGVGDLRGG